MQLRRRNFLQLAAGAAALPALPRLACAQAYPARTVRLVVPVAPGGALDILARLIGQWLTEHMGQTFVIENRPGGGTNIGVDVVAHAPPDGYTLLLIPQSVTTNATLYRDLNFNFIRDIVPIAMISKLPLVMEITDSIPAKTVPEFIAYAKANPGKISMASGGSGSAAERSESVTASARTLPPRIAPIDSGSGLNITCTCPPIRSVSAGAPPR